MSKHLQVCRAAVDRTSAGIVFTFKVRLQSNVWLRYAWREIFLLITTPVALLVMHEANISSGGPQTSAKLWTTATLISTLTWTWHLETLSRVSYKTLID